MSSYGSYSKSRFSFYDDAVMKALEAGKSGEDAAKFAMEALKARDGAYDFVSAKQPPEELGYDPTDPVLKALLHIAVHYGDTPAGEHAQKTLEECEILDTLDKPEDLGTEDANAPKPEVKSLSTGEVAAVKKDDKPGATHAVD